MKINKIGFSRKASTHTFPAEQHLLFGKTAAQQLIIFSVTLLLQLPSLNHWAQCISAQWVFLSSLSQSCPSKSGSSEGGGRPSQPGRKQHTEWKHQELPQRWNRGFHRCFHHAARRGDIRRPKLRRPRGPWLKETCCGCGSHRIPDLQDPRRYHRFFFKKRHDKPETVAWSHRRFL